VCSCADVRSKVNILSCAPHFCSVQFVSVEKNCCGTSRICIILSVCRHPEENYFIFSVSIEVANRSIANAVIGICIIRRTVIKTSCRFHNRYCLILVVPHAYAFRAFYFFAVCYGCHRICGAGRAVNNSIICVCGIERRSIYGRCFAVAIQVKLYSFGVGAIKTPTQKYIRTGFYCHQSSVEQFHLPRL